MEILVCTRCNQEYDLNYSHKNDEEIVSQSNCGCVKQSHNIKPLDRAFEVLNEKLDFRINSVSKVRKGNSKKQG